MATVKQDIPVYDASALHKKFTSIMRKRYPTFDAFSLIFSGPPGCGKSTVLAATPVPEGTIRMVYDMEDSMGFLDGGKNAIDYYAPQHMTFRMLRYKFPTGDNFIQLLKWMENEEQRKKIGMIGVDNLAVFQQDLRTWLREMANNLPKLREAYASVGLASSLTYDAKMRKWANQESPEFWVALKGLATALVLRCKRYGIPFIATTEETNVWQDYGGENQKVIGRKAKIWDVFYRYSDGVITLTRDPNPGQNGFPQPPFGQISKFDPKMRIQGLHPRFVMDWSSFVSELGKAVERINEAIPEEARTQETLAVTIEEPLDKDKPVEEPKTDQA